MIEDGWHDIRYAVRTLLKAPGFTVTALLTLALGIGANTAVFSVLDGVLLRPLPYPEPDRLVSVAEVTRTGRPMSVAYANFRDWRESATGFDAMAAYRANTTTVLGGTQPAWVPVAAISEDLWRVLPVNPVAGRLTVSDDHVDGAPPVALVSTTFARDILGADQPLGRTVEIYGVRAEVVGVLPADFDFPVGAQVWVPLPPQGDSRTAHNWFVVGRLRAGTSLEAAADEVDALMVRLAESVRGDEPDEYLAAGASVTSLRDRLVGNTRRPLYLLLGAAGFVLLVACTNLASTLLARGTARTQELAVRSALGAGRGRLVRHLLAESLVLSLSGSVVGLALTAVLLRALRLVGRESVPRIEEIGISPGVLTFTLLIALLTAAGFGLLPALRTTAGNQATTLRNVRGGVGGQARTWGALVATEVALALLLLVGSGLLIRSFIAVMSEDVGFDPTDVALTAVALSGVKYPELDDHARLWDELLERMEASPGVSAAGVLSNVPIEGAPDGRVELDGDPTRTFDALYVVASSGAFEALDIPLRQGRLFQESDGAGAPHAVVVSRSFAEQVWPGQDPIGHLVSGGGMDNYWDAEPPVFGTVVGVVDDVRYQGLTRAGGPTVYWNYRQRPFRLRFGGTIVVESENGDPAAAFQALRPVIQSVDSDVAVRPRYMRDLLSDSVAARRFVLMVLATFAAIATLLAGIGIYGVVSYAVARRTREVGIRLALGAAPSSVRAMVLGGALRPVAVGLVLGLAAGLSLSRVLRSFLYEVPPTDPLTFAVVPAVLLVAALAASWLPARRGTRIDPVQALRME